MDAWVHDTDTSFAGLKRKHGVFHQPTNLRHAHSLAYSLHGCVVDTRTCLTRIGTIGVGKLCSQPHS
jgi:hypothetical protein